MKNTKYIAVVTGANRGIGFEICRQLAKKGIKVILTSRDEKNGLEAEKKLKNEGLEVAFQKLDVTSEKNIRELTKTIEKEYGRCDILVNNAGVFPDDSSKGSTSVFDAKIETINEAMTTNVYGPLLLSQSLVPLMRKNKYGRIVNMSSGMGQLSEMNGHCPAYRISKTSINALTRMLNDELSGENILVNSMCPGWVKTRMGGEGATRSVDQGADTAVWLATLPDNGPRGKFFRDRKEISW
jgi:NAD(P)-dependent dehydrogenase (short-subunit alcohol dehydrogenase family)